MSRVALALGGGSAPITGVSWWPAAPPVATDLPLVVAIHGGGYTCRYFDVPGRSLMDRAASAGAPIAALNRPGYADSRAIAQRDGLLAANADLLNAAIGELWATYPGMARGVVLIGHSIGAAISVLMASRAHDWPLLGIGISGVGAVPRPVFDPLPPIEIIAVPVEARDALMFGPPGTFDPAVQVAARIANHPVPRQELHEIAHEWPGLLAAAASNVIVPVHYRMGAFDPLWVIVGDAIGKFTSQFANAPFVDAAVLADCGHCVDFHHSGAAFQDQQLAFAKQCAVGVTAR